METDSSSSNCYEQAQFGVVLSILISATRFVVQYGRIDNQLGIVDAKVDAVITVGCTSHCSGSCCS